MTTVKETMMNEQDLARLRAHRNNIQRYRRLLATRLSDLERAYIVKRLREEKAASEALAAATFPPREPITQQPLDSVA